MLTRDDLLAARRRIARHVRTTPVLPVDVPTPRGVVPAVLKLECLQHTGSFKPRGAFNSLLQSDSPVFLAASGGNHGLAVAHAAEALGRKATIVVPTSALRNKVEAMRAKGAEVIEIGEVPKIALEEADRLSKERGWPLIHPYDQEPTVAGQGTIGLELAEQAPEVKHWLCAVGGGGFPAGAALALEGIATVVPVEPEGCPTLFEAQRAGRPVPVKAEGAAKTSLGGPILGEIPWAILRGRVPQTVLVTEEAIAEAQRWLWKNVRIVAEPGGATALSAVLSGAFVPPDRTPVGIVVCGGNADALPG